MLGRGIIDEVGELTKSANYKGYEIPCPVLDEGVCMRCGDVEEYNNENNSGW